MTECKYSKNCKYYDIMSKTCNKRAGLYYTNNRCGKYRINQEIEDLKDAIKILKIRSIKDDVNYSDSINILNMRLKQLQ